MCDRCRVPGCLLNYNGKACANARKEHCPDVFFTNADHIRSMTDEELVGFKYSGPFHCKEKDPRYCKRDKWVNGRAPCEQCYLEWLKQPYKEDT